MHAASVCCGRIEHKVRGWNSNSAKSFSLMPLSGSYARWTFMALLLSSTTFVQSATIEILYNDSRVTYTPKLEGEWCVTNSCDLRKGRNLIRTPGVLGLITRHYHVRYMGTPRRRKTHNQSQFCRVINLSILETVCLILWNYTQNGGDRVWVFHWGNPLAIPTRR